MGEGKNIRDEWATPQDLWDLLNREFRFTLDAAASPANAKTRRFFSEKESCLLEPWRGRVWLNPPYSNSRPFLEKARAEVKSGRAAFVVCLIKAAADTDRYFQNVRFAQEIRRMVGRVHFVPPSGIEASSPKFGCDLVIFKPTTGQKMYFWEWKKELKRSK